VVKMPKSNVHEPSRGPDSEKITINLGYVDLGQIASGVNYRTKQESDGFSFKKNLQLRFPMQRSAFYWAFLHFVHWSRSWSFRKPKNMRGPGRRCAARA
jgi:hypothetical protein